MKKTKINKISLTLRSKNSTKIAGTTILCKLLEKTTKSSKIKSSSSKPTS